MPSPLLSKTPSPSKSAVGSIPKANASLSSRIPRRVDLPIAFEYTPVTSKSQPDPINGKSPRTPKTPRYCSCVVLTLLRSPSTAIIGVTGRSKPVESVVPNVTFCARRQSTPPGAERLHGLNWFVAGTVGKICAEPLLSARDRERL